MPDSNCWVACRRLEGCRKVACGRFLVLLSAGLGVHLIWLQFLCLYAVNPTLPGLLCFVGALIHGVDFLLPASSLFMQNLYNDGYDAVVKFSKQMGAASVQADKIVNVRMSESEHTLLKAYCASLNRSMQDVLRDFALMQIQKQRFCCRLVRSLMEEHGVDQDPRVNKPCFGYACYYCRHAESCMAGETDLLYIPRQEIRELVAEESAYIFDFDGSSIEPPTQVV